MRQRDSYKIWEEGGRGPSVVFEFTSRKTQADDLGEKFRLYEQVLKVTEYYLFDPTGDYLFRRLKGFLLRDGHYVPMPMIDDRIRSPLLGLDLVMDGETLRFHDPETGQFLPSLLESEDLRKATLIARDDAEAENAGLRAELEELRARIAGR